MRLILAILSGMLPAGAWAAGVPDPCAEPSAAFYGAERTDGVTAALARDWQEAGRVWLVVANCPHGRDQFRALFASEEDARTAMPVFMRQMRPDSEREPSNDLVDHDMLLAALSPIDGTSCICDLIKG